VTVYLLHFEEPIAHAKHYLGSAKDLKQRLKQHRQGRGARLLEVAKEKGINFKVSRVWTTKNDKRDLEKKLKARKNSPCLCPFCSTTAAYDGKYDL